MPGGKKASAVPQGRIWFRVLSDPEDLQGLGSLLSPEERAQGFGAKRM